MRKACRIKRGASRLSYRLAAATILYGAILSAPGAAQTPLVGPVSDSFQPMTVPLIWRNRALNDIYIRASPEGEYEIEAKSLEAELRPVLNELGQRRLADVLAGKLFVTPEQMKDTGFRFSFNLNRLELVAEEVDPDLVPVQSFDGLANRPDRLPPTINPARFSAYLNTNLGLVYREDQKSLSPELYLSGAARYGRIVVEAEAGFSDSFDDNYRFYRQAVRAIYDEPEAHRRWSVGDLRLPGTQLLAAPLIAGAAVQKSRRVFDPYYPTGVLGGRQITLTSPSTVDILVNGAPYRSVDLQPGRYDISDLPVEFGANDIQMVVRDAAGRRQVSDFSTFFDPLDLIAGEDEYSAAVGVRSDEIDFQPKYSNDPVAMFNYRRALSGTLLLGGGVQLSKDVQLLSFESQIVPQLIPGSFQLAAAASVGKGEGVALSAGYRWYGGRAETRKVASITVDYQSDGFRSLADFDLATVGRLTATASYSQSFTTRTFMSVGAAYSKIRGRSDQSTIYADVTRRLTPTVNLTGGAEYGTGSIFGRSFGIRLGLTMALGGQQRVDASYQSRRDYARATYSKATDNHAGAFGYSVGVQRSLGINSVDGSFDYIGNRFDARLSVASEGDGLGNITNRQVGRLQVGTSIAFADGILGVGRPINDAFAVVRAHKTVESEVIAGRNLSSNEYEASSGIFGAAVVNRLVSYSPQEIQYDLKNGATGYDIGSGVERVIPSYRAGYSIEVGNDRFVSAVGFLEINGAPASLVSGRITSQTDDGFVSQLFFTNSSGRFGIIGLAPGKHYVVTLNGGGVFNLEVPEDNRGLLRLDRISVSK